MNWSRGLWRIWLVASIIWFATFFARPAYELIDCLRIGVTSGFCVDVWGKPVVIGLVPPIVLLIIGLLGRWIARGFR